MEFDTLGEFLKEITAKYCSKTALSFAQVKYSYQDLNDNVLRVSHWLREKGFEKGDRVAIWSQNRPEWAIAFFATVSLGGVVVGIDDFLPLHEAFYILKDCSAKYLFISSRHLEEFKKVYLDLTALKTVISFDQVEDNFIHNWLDLQQEVSIQQISSEVFPQDLACLIYTSGTTAKAKAIMLQHRNLLANLRQIAAVWQLKSNDKFLSILPLSHTFELTAGLLFPLYFGAEVFYPLTRDIRQILKQLKAEAITIVMIVPAILRLLRNMLLKEIKFFKVLDFLISINAKLPSPLTILNIRKKVFPNLHYFICGGAPVSCRLLVELKSFGFEVLQGYGLSEASPVVAVNTPEANRLGSVGRPLPGLEVKIANDGEILVKGENVMSGYYNDEELTKDTLKDGWLHTGDLGYIDSKGFLWVVGRKKNLIVDERGRNIYPEEIEEMLKLSPFIKDACVIGVKSQYGEKITAIILPEASSSQHDIEKIIAEQIQVINKKLPAFKQIKNYRLVTELPYTSTRKVRRSLLKDIIKKT